MDEKNLPSSSDESDADFVPKDEDDNSDSRSEVSDYESSEEDNNSNSKTRKRKRRSKKGGKKVKKNQSDEEKGEKEEKEVEEDKKEIDVDALWADFKKDVHSLETKKTAESSQASTENRNDTSSKNPVRTNSLNNKPKGSFNIPNKNKGGLSKVLNQIGKKDKMSTLQKSQLDWNKFKKNEGIEEEIKMYNRGKDGFLEKQDFLQRTDLRQFEIEKDLRSSRRKF